MNEYIVNSGDNPITIVTDRAEDIVLNGITCYKACLYSKDVIASIRRGEYGYQVYICNDAENKLPYHLDES